MNDRLITYLPEARFVTCFYAEWDLATMRLNGDESLGDERVKAAVAAFAAGSCRELGQRLMALALAPADGAPEDDVVLVVLRRLQ